MSYYVATPDFYSVFAPSGGGVIAGWGSQIVSVPDSLQYNDLHVTGTGSFSSITQDNEGILFAGNQGGGVYRTTNQGANWSQANAGLTNLSVYSLARDSVNQIYAGTYRGVFRTSNGGQSWLEISTGLPTVATQAMAISPDGYIYAGTPAGVYLNRGTYWERWSDGLKVQDVPALAINQKSDVLAGTWGAGVYSRPGFTVPKPMSFTRVTTSPVVSESSDARATVWGDYDNDGDPDLFIANGAGANNQLYRYDGWPAGFAKVTVGSLVNDGGDSRDPAWGDYDNDGFPDLLVVNYDTPPYLYHNNGNGSFTRITTGPIATDGSSATGAAWVDYDNDGRLDLFIARANNLKNSLFHNEGNGVFSKVLTGDIVNIGGNSQGCSWGDYDNDGYADLYVTNAGQTGFLYHNNGNGTFTRIYTSGTTSVTSNARSCGWVDINNDGWLDLWIASASGEPLLLYRNNGNAQFTEILGGYVWTDANASRPVAWSDFDNDGDVDFFLVGKKNKSVVYLNDGTGRFTRLASGMPILGQDLDGPTSWADYSGDGNLDLFIANTTGARQLHWSDGIGHAALRVRCSGVLSDSRGVNARVAIKATIGGKSFWQYRNASGRDDMSLHFGLGDATIVDSVVVRWPIAGVQVLAPVAIDANLTITEPSTRSVPLLVYPSNRAMDIPTTTTLRWRSSAAATLYHLQISSDTLFSVIEYNDSTMFDTSKVVGPFNLSTTYFWRVRAKGGFGNTAWTDTWSFTTVMPVPDIPLLASPPNGSAHQAVQGVLKWLKNPRATRYQLHLATDSLFQTLLINDSSLADTVRAYTGTFETRHYWRVKAINGSGGSAFTNAWSFLTVLAPPVAPTLKLPPAGSTIASPTVILTWNKPDRATQYQLQVAYDSFFTTRFLNDSALTDTVRPLALSLGSTYYWRVRAASEGGFGPYSATWSFTSNLAAPSRPELTHPVNNAALNSNVVAFVWHKATPEVTRYWHELSSDSLFYISTKDSAITDTAYLRTGLPNGSYWWRVRAANTAGWGAYSDPRKFSVTATGIENKGSIPTEYSLAQNYPNPFNPTTVIRFGLPSQTYVRLTVYSVLGEEVLGLVDGPLAAGYHEVNVGASRLSSGVYFYRLRAGSYVETRKLLLVR